VNKLVEPKGREYRGLLTLGSLFTMKKVYLPVVLIFVILLVFLLYRVSMNNDRYCSQFSGSAGYMEGETEAKECVKAGCQVVNKREFYTGQKIKMCDASIENCKEVEVPISDSGGYEFDCISK